MLSVYIINPIRDRKGFKWVYSIGKQQTNPSPWRLYVKQIKWNTTHYVFNVVVWELDYVLDDDRYSVNVCLI